MNEPNGSQHAIQIALQTLKERCKTLQHRVSTLEEENINLRIQGSQNECDKIILPVSEVDNLNFQIIELTEQKQQLLTKVRLVTSENQDLWDKLSKMNSLNETLGSQLNQISDTLTQYTAKSHEPHSPLIRSKTFTQDEPTILQRAVDENTRLWADLEEISLQVINSYAESQKEMDILFAQMADSTHTRTDNIITNSCGFYYDEYDNNVVDNFKSILDELKMTKETVLEQKKALTVVSLQINTMKEKKLKKHSDTQVKTRDNSTNTLVESNKLPSINIASTNQVAPFEELDRICPMCARKFPPETQFEKFQEHVEQHFVEDS